MSDGKAYFGGPIEGFRSTDVVDLFHNCLLFSSEWTLRQFGLPHSLDDVTSGILIIHFSMIYSSISNNHLY